MIHGGDIYSNDIELDYSVNLNPLGCPEAVKNAVLESLKLVSNYPDINQRHVREMLASADGVTSDMIVAGGGASELIMALVRSINPKKVLLIEPGFYGYRYALNSLDSVSIVQYMLKEEHEYRLDEDILEAMDESLNLIIMANPNNPVGNCISGNLLERIIEKASEYKISVILDESFYYMSDECIRAKRNISKLVNTNYDITIIRSYTKLFAVPGIRAGYAIAKSGRINSIISQLPEWNLSVTSEAVLVSGSKLIRTTDFVKDTCDVICRERDYLIGELNRLNIKTYSSETAFIIIKTDEDKALEGSDSSLYKKLLDRKILIRDCTNFIGLGNGFYRIAVKDRISNEKLIKAIEECVKK